MRPAWRIAALGLGAFAVLSAPVPAAPVSAGERTVRIEATSAAFTPAIIRARVGERITIELVAMDVVHGLYVDGYGVSTRAEPGRPGRLTFVADRAGAFRLRCSVTCGPLHPFVSGTLRVGTNTLLWRALALAVLAAVAGVWALRS